MSERLLAPVSTAAVLLGASDWSEAGLGSAPSFGRSAKELLNYLTTSQGLGLDPDLIIDLFNDRTYAGEQLGYVRDVLGRRLKERADSGHPVSDVIIYYLGHGVTDEQGHLSLLVRRSISGMEIETGIRAPDLARILKLAAPKQRRLVVLDCCFAEAAIKAFVGMGASAQSLTASVAKDFAEGLPASGGLLLCSAPANEISVGAPNAEHTLFTGSLLNVLQTGLEKDNPFFSFNDLRDATYQIMLEKYGAKAPYPVLHPFSPSHGDLARYPAFPNSARDRRYRSIKDPASPALHARTIAERETGTGDSSNDPQIGQRLQRIGYWFSEEVIPIEDLDLVMSAALEERSDRVAIVIRRVLDSPKARAGDVIRALAGIRDRGVSARTESDATITPWTNSPDSLPLATSEQPQPPLEPADVKNDEKENKAVDLLAHLLERQAPVPAERTSFGAAVTNSIGKYEIRGILGRGAMGVVYDGWDPVIERRVAIKTVSIGHFDDPDAVEAVERFRREARAAGRLSHPNIVGVYDYGETSDLAYIVMEFMEGPSLKQLLDRKARFSIPDVRRIMYDLFSGLEFSHERGVVHRDIKPGNVMLTTPDIESCRFKISDFGIARIESSSATMAGTVMGTPAYMAPEQLLGQIVDVRTDIYATGVLLYQLLTGERPFQGNMTSIMHKALNTDPTPPSQIVGNIPQALDQVVGRAMAKRPDYRFQSVGEFRDALQAAFMGHTSPPPMSAAATSTASAPRPSAGSYPAVSSPRRSVAPYIVAAITITLLGILFVFVIIPFMNRP